MKIPILVLTAIILSFTSCKTYYIPVESFKQQFAGMDTANLKEVIVQGPINRVKYKTYPIEYIKVIDNKGNNLELKNSPALEIRFTDKLNKKTIFYFDLMRINGDYITGGESRIVPSIKKTIRISSIKKIEIQNGKKNYRYVNK